MFAFKVRKTSHSQNRDNVSVSYIIFPIYLDREIFFFSWKSHGILSTYVRGNHGSK